MPNPTTLVARIASGEPAAFAELLDTYGERVGRLARRYANSRADAEDLTQEIILDLFRCAGNFRGEAELGTWVYRVALNHCLKFQQRSGRAPEQLPEDFEDGQPESSPGPEQAAVRCELAQQVEGALQRLSPLHREVVVLHELHQLTYQECAAVLGIPVGTVKSRLSNAFSALRTTLRPYVQGDGAEAAPATLRAQPAGGTL